MPSYSPSSIPTWIASIFSLILIRFDKRSAVLIIPFFALISPLAHPNNFVNLLPSEAYVFLLALIGSVSLLLKQNYTFSLKNGDWYLISLIGIVILSTLLSFEVHNLIKSVSLMNFDYLIWMINHH